MEFGLSLQQHDVVLLLSNLPYEKSANSAEMSHDDWTKSDAPISWKRKKQQEAEEDLKKSSNRSVASAASAKMSATNREGVAVVDNRWVERLKIYEASMGRGKFFVDDTDHDLSNCGTLDSAIDVESQHDVQPTWTSAESTAALVHHLHFIHTTRGKRCDGVWAEALHIIASKICAEHPDAQGGAASISLPAVMIPAVTATIRMVPPQLRCKLAINIVEKNIRGPTPFDHDLLRTLCAAMCPVLRFSRRLHTIRRYRVLHKSIKTVLSRLSSSSSPTDVSTFRCVTSALLVDSFATNPSSIQLEAVSSSLIQMLGSLYYECTHVFSESTARDESSTLIDGSRKEARRFMPMAFEQNLSICSASLKAAGDLLAIFHQLTCFSGTNYSRRWSPDTLARAAFLGTHGLFHVREVIFSPAFRNHQELKAVKNAAERNALLLHFCKPVLAWLAGMPCQEKMQYHTLNSPLTAKNHVLAMDTAAKLLVACADAVDDMVFGSHERKSACALTLKAVMRCMQTYELHGCKNQTLSAHLSLHMQRDSSFGELCVALVRITSLVLPLTSRVEVVRIFKGSRKCLAVLLVLSAADNAAGRFVRERLSASTAQHLDKLVLLIRNPGRSREGKRALVGRENVSFNILRRTASPRVQFMRKREYTEEIYAIASSSLGDAGKSNAIEALVKAKAANWLDAARIMNVLIFGVRIASSSLSLGVYQAAIQQLSVPIGDDHRVPLAAWQTAINLFWHAVDGLPNSQIKMLTALDSTILPLLRVCVACGKQHEARRWNEMWQRLHAQQSSDEYLGSDHYLASKLTNAVVLKERDSVSQVAYFLDDCRSSVELRTKLNVLLLEAVQTMCDAGRWDQAIRALTTRRRVSLLETPEGSLAFLRCLSGSTTSLYRTAESTFQEHSHKDWWSAEHSALVLRTFTRSRRWKDALSLLANPICMDLHLASQKVLLEGLRACANGGQSDVAEVLFAAYQAAGKAVRTSDQHVAKSLFLRAITKKLSSIKQ